VIEERELGGPAQAGDAIFQGQPQAAATIGKQRVHGVVLEPLGLVQVSEKPAFRIQQQDPKGRYCQSQGAIPEENAVPEGAFAQQRIRLGAVGSRPRCR